MKLKLKPKFSIGQTVYKVCEKCFDCKVGHYVGCGIKCYNKYSYIALKTKVDAYKIVKNKDGKYEVMYHIENGSYYNDDYEKENALFKTKDEAKHKIIKEGLMMA